MSDSSDENTEKAPKPDAGLTIYRNKTSMAFVLISFMVVELYIVYDMFKAPFDVSRYNRVSRDAFFRIKQLILGTPKDTKMLHLNLEDSILLYMIIDMTCKSMVSDVNEDLIQLAETSLDVSRADYGKLRSNYLSFAERLIRKMNETYDKYPEFHEAIAPLHD